MKKKKRAKNCTYVFLSSSELSSSPRRFNPVLHFPSVTPEAVNAFSVSSAGTETDFCFDGVSLGKKSTRVQRSAVIKPRDSKIKALFPKIRICKESLGIQIGDWAVTKRGETSACLVALHCINTNTYLNLHENMHNFLLLFTQSA